MAQDLQRMRQGKEELQTGKKTAEGERAERKKGGRWRGFLLLLGRSASSLWQPVHFRILPRGTAYIYIKHLCL